MAPHVLCRRLFSSFSGTEGQPSSTWSRLVEHGPNGSRALSRRGQLVPSSIGELEAGLMLLAGALVMVSASSMSLLPDERTLTESAAVRGVRGFCLAPTCTY